MENGETDEEVGEIAMPQRGDNPREFHIIREFHEGMNGLRLVRSTWSGQADDSKRKSKENGHGGAGVMREVKIHRFDLAQTQRKSGEWELRVAEFEKMLDVALRVVHVELAELGIRGFQRSKPVAIVLIAKMRLQSMKRLEGYGALDQQIGTEGLMAATQKIVQRIDWRIGKKRRRQQTRFFRTGIMIPTYGIPEKGPTSDNRRQHSRAWLRRRCSDGSAVFCSHSPL